MNKKIQVIAIVGAIIFSIFVLTSPDTETLIPLPKPNPYSENDSVIILAENLNKPRAIAISDDRIFVTEKDGYIRVIQNNTLLESPLATFRTANVFDGGLLGIAVHPDFSNNHFLYVFLTYEENGNLWNKILRIIEDENKLKNVEIIFDKIPGSSFTNGGFLKFGPDKKLYVGTGTISDDSHLPQDITSLSGKILRLNDDGTIPDDNPFSNSPVYSLGHRNPQGMTWDDDDNLFVAEFGPEKNDEINLIKAGKNYGWPEQQCSGNPDFENAILCYDPSIEPGGILFYSGDRINFADNDVYRAVTHNKGIMNGIVSVANAIGQDSRAIEAAANAYAAISGKYRSLSKWSKDNDGNLVGILEIPLSVGIVGGIVNVHPVAKVCAKILNVTSAQELACVMTATGLAQNYSAIRALSTEGIQKGHMRLHARNLAAAAGATPAQIDQIVEKMIQVKSISLDKAKELLRQI